MNTIKNTLKIIQNAMLRNFKSPVEIMGFLKDSFKDVLQEMLAAEILGDIVVAKALLDRLTHKCQVLSFSDESYRLAHRKQIFEIKDDKK